MNDGGFVRIEPASELFLKRRQFLRKLGCAEQSLPHFDESADDENAHPDRVRAIQDIGDLEGTVFSESPGGVFAMLPPAPL